MCVVYTTAWIQGIREAGRFSVKYLSILVHTYYIVFTVSVPQALEAARADHEKFISDRQTRRDTRMSSNRTQEQVFLEQLEADLESDNPWERIVSLVDTQVCTR
jgi:Clathrin light chain